MNKKLKRGALALGTLATIVAPVAAVVSCGTEANTINWKDTDKYGGVNGDEFLQQIKHLGKAKQNAITVGKEQMMQLQYESESIRSIMAQLDDFKYQNWQTEMENVQHGYDEDQAVKDKASYMASITTGGVVDKDKKDQSIIDGFDNKIKGFEDAVKTNEDQIMKVQGFIDTLETLGSKLNLTGEYLQDKDDAVKNFYANDYKSSDYPNVYKPLTKIREEKEAIVQDAYKNFYPQYTTRAAGDAEWPKELAANYGGAATFDQAIDYLVTNEITAKAFNSYKFEINRSFTVEQMLWARLTTKADATNTPYKFLVGASSHLNGADLKLIGEDLDTFEENVLKIKRGDMISIKPSQLSSNVLFIGSTSPDHRMSQSAYDDLGKVVKYQHLLIKATQGKTADEAWTITADDLKKLLNFDRYEETKGGKVAIKQGAELLTDDKIFKDDDDGDDFTDFVLGQVSGNSAGTIKIQGSLGIKSEIEYLKAMVPGFSLGALGITEGVSNRVETVTDLPTSAKEGDKALVGTLADGQRTLYHYVGGIWEKVIKDIDLSSFIAALKDAMTKAATDTYPSYGDAVTDQTIDTKNDEIASVITALGDDKVKAIFGKVFLDFFKDKTGLIYKLAGSTDKYVVISQFGIHIIKRTSYDSPAAIEAALDADIKKMAGDSSLTSSTTIVSELNSAFTDTKIMDLLLKESIKPPAVGTEPKKVSFPYKEALEKKLTEYNEGKDQVDQVSIDDIVEVIESVNKLKSKTDVDGAIGDKLENWLVSQLDTDLRTLDTDVDLSDIYGWAKAAEGVVA